MEFKKRIVGQYPDLFAEGNKEQVDLSPTGNFGTKWGWYQSIYGLAKGDVTKFDKVTELNVHQCLLYLAFEKDKLELETKLIKKR